MNLSIITPAAPKRLPRIAMIFNRLKLNAKRHPDIQFEFILVDDSLDQEYRQLAVGQDWGYPVKYISLPLAEPYPNPSYMRNVGFRVAEGEIFTMIDADHWVHEDFVEGALEPFKVEPVLNTGFMIDTSKGNEWHRRGIGINQTLINRAGDMDFKFCMQLTGINGPVPWLKVWLASYPSDIFLGINGYDEKYTTGYSREDDDIYYRLATKLPVYNKNYKSFCGVHLWHPQVARSNAKNALNRAYYQSVVPQDSVRNQGHEWGKFVEGATSEICGVKRGFHAHEEYVKSLGRVEHYTQNGARPWKDFAELQECVKK